MVPFACASDGRCFSQYSGSGLTIGPRGSLTGVVPATFANTDCSATLVSRRGALARPMYVFGARRLPNASLRSCARNAPAVVRRPSTITAAVSGNLPNAVSFFPSTVNAPVCTPRIAALAPPATLQEIEQIAKLASNKRKRIIAYWPSIGSDVVLRTPPTDGALPG